MPTITLHTTKTRTEVMRLLSDLPQTAGGATSEAVALRRAIGLAALVQIHKDFRVKATGGTDVNGLTWKALRPSTIRMKAKVQGRIFKRGTVAIPGIEILRETDALSDSLDPAKQSDKQVLRTLPNAVVVGSSVDYALAHHEGLPDKTPPLPQRRLWADPKRWRGAWWRPILQTVSEGLIRIIREAL